MVYTDLLTPDAIRLKLEAASADEVLQDLVELLVKSDPELESRKDEVLNALREREARGSTASQRVGIPHVKLAGVNKVSMAVAVSPKGVDFAALDGGPVHVFFSVIRPEDKADEHLDLLRWIAGIARHEDFVQFALQATTPEQLIDLLTELSPTSA